MGNNSSTASHYSPSHNIYLATGEGDPRLLADQERNAMEQQWKSYEPADILLIISLFVNSAHLPLGIVENILHLAMICTDVRSEKIGRNVNMSSNMDDRYLSLECLSDEKLTSDILTVSKCVRLIVECGSHDQAWSSYVQDHNTYRGSWTWAELAIEDPAKKTQIGKRQEIYRNVHASGQFRYYRRIYSESSLLAELQPGRQVVLCLRSRFSGWIFFAEKARLVALYALTVKDESSLPRGNLQRKIRPS